MALTIPEGPKMDALVAALEAISEVMEESDAGAALSAARAEQYAIAAGKYGNMSAYAVSVDPGESAAVAKTEEEDGYRLTFSIPRGDQGKGISSIALTNDYKLLITYTDGTTWTTPESIKGPKGDSGTAENLGLCVVDGALCYNWIEE